MSRIPQLVAIVALCGGPAMAQTAPVHHHTSHKKPHASAERPIDNGPQTPDANKAYQGGGVVLQGAPGAPAPAPQATPPGRAPGNAVPQ